MVNYVNQPCMGEVKARSLFLHVCVPGQEDHAADWTETYVPLRWLR